MQKQERKCTIARRKKEEICRKSKSVGARKIAVVKVWDRGTLDRRMACLLARAGSRVSTSTMPPPYHLLLPTIVVVFSAPPNHHYRRCYHHRVHHRIFLTFNGARAAIASRLGKVESSCWLLVLPRGFAHCRDSDWSILLEQSRREGRGKATLRKLCNVFRIVRVYD